MRGELQGIDATGLSGWVMDEDRPNQPVSLQVLVDGTVVGSVLADRPRAIEGSPSQEGSTFEFSWLIPDAFRDGQPHRFEVRNVLGEGLMPVPPLNGPVALTASEITAPDRTEFRGHLDEVDVVGVRGWAQDPKCPTERVTVEILIDGNVIGMAVADQYRADLEKDGIGDGNHGFAWNFPPGQVPAGPHIVQARVNMSHILEATAEVEKPFVFPEPSAPSDEQSSQQENIAFAEGDIGLVEFIDASGIRGWLSEAVYSRSAEVEILIDGDVVGSAVASEPRTDLHEGDAEAKAYEFSWSFPQHLLDGNPHRYVVRIKQNGKLLTLPPGFESAVSLTISTDAIAEMPVPSGVEGVVDSIESEGSVHVVNGWVLDHRDLTKPVELGIYLDGQLVVRGRAESYRHDIYTRYGGHGFYGFKFRLNRQIDKRDFEKLQVRVLPDDLPLAFLPEIDDKLPNAKPPRQGSAQKGHLDRANREAIQGWAIDESDLAKPQVVDIAVNSVVIRTTIAGQPRSDIERLYPGVKGHGGFGCQLPQGISLSGKASISVTWTESAKNLTNSPQVVEVGRAGTMLDLRSLRAFKISARRRQVVPTPPPTTIRPKVAAIVLNRDGGDLLEALFSSLELHNTYENFEVLVIDHGSSDSSAAVCQRWRNRLPIRVFNRLGNYSYAASNNYGALLTDADILFLLNNDIILDGDLISTALPYLTDDVGVLGVKLVTAPSQVRFTSGATRQDLIDLGYAIDQVQHLGVRITTSCHDRPFMPFEEPINRDNEGFASLPIEVPAVTAAALFVRRSDFLAIGGFHEGYFYGFEDVDFCLTFAALLRKKIVCLNNLKAYHHRSASIERSSPAERLAKSANRKVLLERLGAHIQDRLRHERMANTPFLRDGVVRIGFAVTEASPTTAAGDYFTALELAKELTNGFHFECVFLERLQWYELRDCDVVVAMVEGFKPSQIKSARADIIIIAWVRNWFDRWLNLDELSSFDAIWVSSGKARDAFLRATHRPIYVVRIATNVETFSSGNMRLELRSDYCFTGSYFGSWRQLIGSLAPNDLPYEFALFGHGWNEVAWLQPYYRGALPYDAMPDIYASTKIVVDDANQTTVAWGSVNSRVFDAIAAGALVITNSQTASDDSFDGLLPVYTTKESLSLLLSRYLGDDDARRDLVEKLQRIVRERHTYRIRAEITYSSIKKLFEARRICLRLPPDHADRLTPLWNAVERVLLGGGHIVHAISNSGALARARTFASEIDMRMTGLDAADQDFGEVENHRANVLIINCEIDQLRPSDLRRFDLLVVPGGDDVARCRQFGCDALALSAAEFGPANMTTIERRLRLQVLFDKNLPELLAVLIDRCDEIRSRKAFAERANSPTLRASVEESNNKLRALRIAYVLWDFPSLSQTFVLNEIRWLVEHGHDIKVYFKADPDRAATLDFNVESYRVEDAEDLASLLQLHDRTIMHAHFAYPAGTLLTFPASQATGIPFTLMPHAVDIFHHANMNRNRIVEMTRNRACLGVIALGSFHLRFLAEQGVPGEKIVLERQAVTVPKPGDLSSRRGGRRRPRVISIGRMIEKKGFRYLIEAAQLLPDFDFVLYGYGPLEAELKELADRLRLENMSFGGSLETMSAVWKAYADADIFALPCIRAADGDMDGLPTVLLEAMAANVPVVTTPVAGIPDLVIDGITGFLCKSKDSADLASTLRKVHRLPPVRRNRVVAAARQRMLSFSSVDRTMRTLMRVWQARTVDIVLVTYDRGKHRNWADTDQILSRIFKYTTPPFEVYVVDNGSEIDFITRLEENYGDLPNFHLIRSDRNLWCGPATNIAIEHGKSDYILYLCSKEGYVFKRAWERELVHYMDEHPKVALAGHLVTLRDHYDGGTYLLHPEFAKFRNQEFAKQNRRRPFAHVQGGVYILRREAYERSGGFSTLVPQGGTDIEYSYFLESCGWELGNIPNIYSKTTLTQPGVEAIVDEHMLAVHPVTARTVDRFDRIASATGKSCNICSWQGSSFVGDQGGGIARCPSCNSSNFSRTVLRLLAIHDTLAKRPRIFAVLQESSLADTLRKLAPTLTLVNCEELEQTDPWPNAEEVDLAIIDHMAWSPKQLRNFVSWATKFVKTGRTLVVGAGIAKGNGAEGRVLDPLEALADAGVPAVLVNYNSSVIEFDWQGIGAFNVHPVKDLSRESITAIGPGRVPRRSKRVVQRRSIMVDS